MKLVTTHLTFGAALLWLHSLLTIDSAHGHGDHHHHHRRQERKLKEGNIFDRDTEDIRGKDPDGDPNFAAEHMGDKEGSEIVKEVKPSREGDDLGGDDNVVGFACGIGDPTDEELMLLNELVTEYKEGSRGDFMTEVTVPICFHVITTTDGALGDISDAQLQLQVDALNYAFSDSSCCDTTEWWCIPGTCSSDTGFRFEMEASCTTRTANSDWYFADWDTPEDTAMKQTLRVGGPDVLNVYYHELPGFLGISWFPWWIDDRLWRDGINMLNTVLVGGTYFDYLEGDILAHEVGHWLGVYHTFQGGCFPNEGVLDTSPESEPAYGCPIGRDTCGGAGVDPIHNFMDYTYDNCKFEFTPDQIAVMHVSHAVFRAEGVARDMLTLEDGVFSDTLTLAEEEYQIYNYTLGGIGPVTCVVSYFDDLTGQLCTSNCMNGNAQLYLRWEAPPNRFRPYDCASQDLGSYESCTSTPSPGDTTLYVGVYAQVTFLDLVTLCYEEDAAIIPLSNNTASSSTSLVTNSTQAFKFPVLSYVADVTCFSTCDNGNADMFVSLDYISLVNGAYDCVSAESGSVEQCTVAGIESSVSEEVFVSIAASEAFTSLTVTCYEVPADTIVLRNGIPSGLLSLSRDQGRYYRYSVNFSEMPGSVTCTIEGDSGDADMIVLWSARPLRDELYDCGSFSGSSYESCTVDVPSGASDLYILVYAFTSFSNVRVTCTEDVGSHMPTFEPTSSMAPSSEPSLRPTLRPTSSSQPSPMPSFSNAPSAESERLIMYGVTNDGFSSSLYAIDGQSGSAEFVGVVLEAGTAWPLRLKTLAFDRTTDTLYGHTSDVELRRFDYLVVIDVSTAEATLIGQASRGPMMAMAFDSSGQLFGWNEYNVDGLYLIDKHTGVETLVGLSGVFTEEVGLAFDSDGILHLLNDSGEYYVVDPVTGNATFVGYTISNHANGDIFPGTKEFYQVEYPSGGRIFVVDLPTLALVRTVPTGVTSLSALAVGPERGTLSPTISAAPTLSMIPSSEPTTTPLPTLTLSMIPSSEPTMTPLPTTVFREIVLRNGVPSAPLSLGIDEEQYYLYPLNYPHLPGTVTCTIAGPNGDADLMVQWSDFPVRDGTYDCLPFLDGSNEICTLDVPIGASNLYILVYGFSSFSDVVVTCTEVQGSSAPSSQPSVRLSSVLAYAFSLPTRRRRPSTLFQLDPLDGSATRIGDITLYGTRTHLRIGAMAFDPSSDTLYAHTSRFDQNYRDYLVTIDVATAEATLIGQASTSPLKALAFDASGQLFAWNEFEADDLYIIDKHTGADTRVGLSPRVLTGNVGLAFDDAGVLHLLNENGDYYLVDPTSGFGTPQGTIAGRSFVTGRGDILPGTKRFFQVQHPRGGSIEVADLDTMSVVRIINTNISHLYGLTFVQSEAPP